jgi:AraC-like DNA-binding protein
MMQATESYQRFNQILSFINERAFNNISIQDVADNLSLSVRQTSRICHSLFGCTINQLISQVRIQQICFLLTRSDNSISKIAEMAGFPNPYTFSRFFSHQTGVSPSTYRKNYEIKKE